MMRDAGRPEQAATLLEALELGVRFQLQTQFLPETVLYLRDPARALGGFQYAPCDHLGLDLGRTLEDVQDPRVT